MALVQGDIIGPYEIIGPLGQGGMASVYKAYHAKLDRYAAIKMMHQGYLDDPTFLSRFQREAQIIARLEHPHIVPVYDYGEHEGKPYLVMKLIEGHTLKAEIEENPLSLDRILHVVSAVSSALDYAHKNGVLHRDVKPSNIVIDNQDMPFLTDFGLARMTQSGESTMSQDLIIGTPHYISPEQAKGGTRLDGRTDVYSFGVVVYELIVGRVPFSSDTPYAIVHDHIYSTLPLPTIVNPEVPLAIEKVLIKALAKKPEDRYATAGEMVADLKSQINRSGLISLNANRAEVAQKSFAQLREQDDLVDFSESPRYTPIPLPSGGSVQIISGAAARQRAKARRNLWVLVGLATLVAIIIASMIIIMNAFGNLAEVAQLASRPSLSTISPVAQNPPLSVPPLQALSEAQTAVAADPNNPSSYLALAQAQLAEGLNSEFGQTVQEGTRYTSGEERPLYFLQAAQIAAEAGDERMAAEMYIRLVEDTPTDHTAYPQIREAAGRYLYELAISLDTAVGPLANETSRQRSPILRAINGRYLLMTGREALARTAVARALQDDSSLAEAHLIKGELHLQIGELDDALREWDFAASAPNAPVWVQNRANELKQANTESQ